MCSCNKRRRRHPRRRLLRAPDLYECGPVKRIDSLPVRVVCASLRKQRAPNRKAHTPSQRRTQCPRNSSAPHPTSPSSPTATSPNSKPAEQPSPPPSTGEASVPENLSSAPSAPPLTPDAALPDLEPRGAAESARVEEIDNVD